MNRFTGTNCRSLGKMLGLDIPIYPVQGQILHTESTEDTVLNHVIFGFQSHLFWDELKLQHKLPAAAKASELPDYNIFNDDFKDKDYPPIYCTHDVRGRGPYTMHLYGKQNANGTVSFGGCRIPVNTTACERGSDGAPILPWIVNVEASMATHAYLKRIIPCVESLEYNGTTMGYMPFSFDADNPGVPSVRRANDNENLWLACGFGPKGIMLGMSSAEKLAREIVLRRNSS